MKKGQTYFIQHPNNDKAILVTAGQFLVHFIPSDNLNLTTVSFQRLIHGQVGISSKTFRLPILPCLKIK